MPLAALSSLKRRNAPAKTHRSPQECQVEPAGRQVAGVVQVVETDQHHERTQRELRQPPAARGAACRPGVRAVDSVAGRP